MGKTINFEVVVNQGLLDITTKHKDFTQHNKTGVNPRCLYKEMTIISSKVCNSSEYGVTFTAG